MNTTVEVNVIIVRKSLLLLIFIFAAYISTARDTKRVIRWPLLKITFPTIVYREYHVPDGDANAEQPKVWIEMPSVPKVRSI